MTTHEIFTYRNGELISRRPLRFIMHHGGERRFEYLDEANASLIVCDESFPSREYDVDPWHRHRFDIIALESQEV